MKQSDTEIAESTQGEDPGAFDFDGHRLAAEDSYRKVKSRYEDFAETVGDLLSRSLETEGIVAHSIEWRAKTVDSFGKKAMLPSLANPEAPKYPTPLDDITDLAAARVITFFLSTLKQADECIRLQFEVLERIDRSSELEEHERLGYQSVHYLVALKTNRLTLPEYERFKGVKAEIQARTILQHAWAEIEHDIQYKSVDTLPVAIRRRFLALAGMLEIGDREFQAIAVDNEKLRAAARESVQAGELQDVEITPDSLKTYLDHRMSADGRMREWSYNWTARLLKGFGFTRLEQVENALTGYDDDSVSRLTHGSRQGQLSRFEDVLLASMGELFIERHHFNRPDIDWWVPGQKSRLNKLKRAGVPIGNYDPLQDPAPVPKASA